MRECVCLVVLLLVLVAVIDVLDEDVLLAVEHDVAELVEEREPERIAVLETVVQLDAREKDSLVSFAKFKKPS